MNDDSLYIAQRFNNLGMEARKNGEYIAAIENYTRALSFYYKESYFYNRAQAQLFVNGDPRVNAFLALDDFIAYLLLNYREFSNSPNNSDHLMQLNFLQVTAQQCYKINKCFYIAYNRFGATDKSLKLMLEDLIADTFSGHQHVEYPEEWQVQLVSFSVLFDFIERMMLIQSEFDKYFNTSREDVVRLLADDFSKHQMIEFITLLREYMEG